MQAARLGRSSRGALTTYGRGVVRVGLLGGTTGLVAVLLVAVFATSFRRLTL